MGDDVVFFNMYEQDEKKRMIDEYYNDLKELERLKMVYNNDYSLRTSIRDLKKEYNVEKRNYEKIIKLLKIIHHYGIELIEKRETMEIGVYDIVFKDAIYKINRLLLKIKNIEHKNVENSDKIQMTRQDQNANVPPYNTFNNDKYLKSKRPNAVTNEYLLPSENELMDSIDKNKDIDDFNIYKYYEQKNRKINSNSRNRLAHNNNDINALSSKSISSDFKKINISEKNINTERIEQNIKENKNDEVKILISHSTANKKEAKKIISILEAIGVDEDAIICTSATGYGVPAGEDIVDYLKQTFDYKLIMIYLISEKYFESRYCLNEMGAAWVKSSAHLVVNIDESKIDDCVLRNTNKYVDLDKEGLSEISSFFERHGIIDQVSHNKMVKLQSKIL